jgi:hypothetical protein
MNKTKIILVFTRTPFVSSVITCLKVRGKTINLKSRNRRIAKDIHARSREESK